jgi:transcription initiation factor IIE alpha subunit
MDRRLKILSSPELPSSHKLVAIALIDAENDQGYVTTITQAMLANTLSIHPNHINRIIRDLREWGFIESFVPEHQETFRTRPRQAVYQFVGEYAPQ